MRILTTLTAATALAGFTTAATAGGLSPEIMEAPVVAAEPAPAPGSSINPAFIVVGVLAALLIASSSSSSDGDGEGTTNPPLNGLLPPMDGPEQTGM
ncbi:MULTISPECIES: hypothetical protein [unclassified Yoonia]|uniref:hypothetical protein n=1 Tax=unclassified Yoonia TaxID=2629118 RepID=UPI002AFDE200|nr:MULTISPECIES: hypothetical protein [unclassified Yoonia]